MPDLIGHLSCEYRGIQKRHLAWVEMPLKCFEIVTLYDDDKDTNYMIPARINRDKKGTGVAVTPQRGPVHSCVMTDFRRSALAGRRLTPNFFSSGKVRSWL